MVNPHVVEKKIEEVTHRLIDRVKKRYILRERGEDKAVTAISKDITADKKELFKNIRILK